MPDPLTIEVTGVGKRFSLTGRAQTLKSAVLGMFRRPPRRDFWALKDVSFHVAPGETLGIIGANGAGKSTLLSLIAQTIHPTEGAIRTRGTVSSLLELGAGFHPELTGRENVFLYGAIMGLSKAQMTERFDRIVEFAGLLEFIDQPIKHYSSGMYVRLGFAVAVEVDPDILIIDEVLAVGDMKFQRKCLDRINDFKARGKTMLIVSHDMETIRKISDRILFLEEGRVRGIGRPEELVDQYRAASRLKEAEGLRREWGTGQATITNVEILDAAGVPAEEFAWKAPLKARIRYTAKERIEKPVFGFAVANKQGQVLYGSNTQVEGFDIPAIEGEGTLTLTIDPLTMGKGTYLLSFSLHSWDHKTNYHRMDNCFPIAVSCDKPFEGAFMPCHWTAD